MEQFIADLRMSIVTCDCGLTWAAPTQWFKDRQEDHKTFNCPNGCSRHYPKENKEERLQRLLNHEQLCCIAAREEANTLERKCRAYKGHLTRLKKDSD